MATLEFITDDTLRRMIERDKREMYRSLEVGSHKSVLVLAGSIIEAILVDYFLAFPPSSVTPTKISRASLAQLVEWAEAESLISKRAYEISTIIRNYRNLIHPGKEYRLQERVDVHSASVAAHLVEIITEEIGENYSEKLGYKAEAAIEKVKIDPSCASIFKNMVGQMSTVERVKLFRMIPGVCQEEDILEETVENFIRLHEVLAKSIPPNVIEEEAERIKDYLNHKSRDEILFYLRFFMEHLGLLDENSRSAVLTYLLDLLWDCSHDVLLSIDKIGRYRLGKYLNNSLGMDTLNAAVEQRLYRGNPEDDDLFLDILEGIFTSLPTEYKKEVKRWLSNTGSDRASYWVERIENFVPF